MDCKFCTESLKRLDGNTLDYSLWMKEENVTSIAQLHEEYNKKRRNEN